jgi:hypothetical protein
MNPSSAGWIEKFGALARENKASYDSFEKLYHDLKSNGFVYGISIGVPSFAVAEHPFSDDERAKINLLNGLYFTFQLKAKDAPFAHFLERIFEFYSALELDHVSFIGKLFAGKKTSSKLEKLIASRIYLEDTLLGKTFNSFITNSLLFVDVLLFKEYLEDASHIKLRAGNLEYLAINIAYHALNSKQKNKSDEKLAHLLEASLTYMERGTQQQFDGSYRDMLLQHPYPFQKQYLLDIACLTVWEDKSLDYTESEFVFGIGKDMGFQEATIGSALRDVTLFFAENAEKAPFLKEDNLAIQFYDGMGKVVNKLILRNSKRLQKELAESAELVALLSKSTVRDLSREEKKKVQNQLLDIFKSIPSLAIFMLPGGAILLPLFIKLIPKLLPSSFDENRVENDQKAQ